MRRPAFKLVLEGPVKPVPDAGHVPILGAQTFAFGSAAVSKVESLQRGPFRDELAGFALA